ncbi:hypothetical protein, partial [Mesorhizobium sp. M2A.F.Ca.ET.039.01.1.1]|uniref:hypothetical protein n=1 Tax=Mesorhizobium sp. M2A.F.Ca.ET.039.01.1.1 TaxID=2496746 RepID=UPI001AECC878
VLERDRRHAVEKLQGNRRRTVEPAHCRLIKGQSTRRNALPSRAVSLNDAALPRRDWLAFGETPRLQSSGFPHPSFSVL